MNQFDPRHQARIAFVQSCWHKEIVDQCRTAFTQKMGDVAIDFFEVPGAFEYSLVHELWKRRALRRRDLRCGAPERIVAAMQNDARHFDRRPLGQALLDVEEA